MSFGPLSFLYPSLFWIGLSLPIIWLVIRALPPKPQDLTFPPLMILKKISGGDPPPDKAPWWILLLRLLMASLIIIALSQPILNPAKPLAGNGPVVLLVDNGWQSASRWQNWLNALTATLDKAARQERPIFLVPTSPNFEDTQKQNPSAPSPQLATSVRQQLANLTPKAASPNYDHVIKQLADIDLANSHVIWFSDGLSHPNQARLVERLSDAENVDVKLEASTDYPLALLPLKYEGLNFNVTLTRPERDFAASNIIRAFGRDGRPLSEVEASFEAGSSKTSATIPLPAAQRNDIGRIAVLNEESAGTTLYTDGRSNRPLTGLITGENVTGLPPLKTARHFLSRALENRTSILESDLDSLLENDIRLLLMANIGRMNEGRVDRLERWVREGGVLIRFAGNRMENGVDNLIPVTLRLGNRSFGGALSWDKAKPLAPFPEESPFYGIAINDEITVTRQLLAAPDITLADHTWASLADGTPLVTGKQLGNGWVVLFHTTANLNWSNLAASGVFVDMLERLLPLATSNGGSGSAAQLSNQANIPMEQVMDGFGRLSTAPLGMPSLSLANLSSIEAGLDLPAGTYGIGQQRVALNLMAEQGPIDQAFTFKAGNYGSFPQTIGFMPDPETDLKPLLYSLVVLLLIADMVAALWLRGMIGFTTFAPSKPTTSTITKVIISLVVPLAAMLVVLGGNTASAQQIIPDPPSRTLLPDLNSNFVQNSTGRMRLAYIPTGNPTLDGQVASGLNGLSMMMRIRTSVSLGPAFPVDPNRDPINLFPLIYWPITENTEPLTDKGIRQINDYLQAGGMVFFDLGVGDPAIGSNIGMRNPEREAKLQEITQNINIPPLVEVDNDHVLSKSYYLLERFPGRIDGRQVWAEKSSKGEDPQVSGIIIGSHDWVSTWSFDANNLMASPNLSGGQQQKELSLRFGVNLVMYALTGTYKNDTIHLETIINRLRN